MTKSYIISQYPLTFQHLEQFSEVVGERPEPLIISNITSSSYTGIIRYLASLKADTLYIPKVENESTPLIPVLKCLSLFVRVKKRVLVETDFKMRSFSTLEGLRELLGLGLGCLEGGRDLCFYWIKLRGLPATRLVQFNRFPKGKILYFRSSLGLGVRAGGAIAHTNGVISSFLAKNYDVDYASTEPPHALPENVKLKYFHLKPPQRYAVPRDLNFYSHSISSFKQIIKKPAHPYEFIYQRHSTGNMAGVLASQYWSLPLVLEYNGSEVWLSANWGRPLFFAKMAMRVEEACLKHASLIVVVSDVLRDELIGRGVEAERVITCPNGVNTAVYDAQRFSNKQIATVRKRYGIKDDAVVATFVGTFGHWHGVEELAKTLRLMVKENREWMAHNKLHIMFIGDGAKREMVEEILSDPDLVPFFTLTGLIPQNKAPLYMAASDILMSPHVPNLDGSPFFGSPIKIFEYLSTGRSVIASKLDQIGEILEGCPMVSEKVDYSQPPIDGACGIMVNPREPKEIRSALMALVENPKWRRQAGINGRIRAIERYTWDHHTDIILKKLSSILETPPQTTET